MADVGAEPCQCEDSPGNTLAHELETVAGCLPSEEEGEEDVNMRSVDRRDESGGDEHASSVMDQCQNEKFIPSKILNG